MMGMTLFGRVQLQTFNVPAFLLLSVGLVGCWGPRGDSKEAREDLRAAIGWCTGTAGSIDEAKASGLFKEAAQAGGPLATMWAARLMLTGDCGWTEDHEEAISSAKTVTEDVRVLAERGDTEAAFLLGNAYQEGLGVTTADPNEARRWLLKAAEHGHSLAQLDLAKLLWHGDGIERDRSEALRWFRSAAGQGDAWAQFYLGIAYYAGYGVLEDTAAAATWYRKAADRGLAEGQYALALSYWEGQGVEKDLAEAHRLLRLAASQGHVEAQTLLGDLYSSGDGVDVDHEEAVSWYRLAAVQGHAEAQRKLGTNLQSGLGVYQDRQEAIMWFEKAAAQGDGESQYYLGQAYMQGVGVPQDYLEAHKWFKQAAHRGHFAAQLALVGTYYSGDGPVPRDIELAYVYMSLATANPNKTPVEGMLEISAAFRNVLAAMLSREQLARAQATATALQHEIDDSQKSGEESRTGGASAKDEGAPDITGSGVVVAGGEILLTNAHVVKECRVIGAIVGGKRSEGRIGAIDTVNDIALVELTPPAQGEVTVRGPVPLRLGEEIVVVGFPLQGLLTSTPQVTTGVVSSLAGPGDDSRLIQISAALQPGNSGGPVLDRSGNLIGVAVGKLDAILVAKAIGTLPENVGFAIRSDILVAFLNGQSVKFKTGRSKASRDVPEIGEQARSYVARVECWK